MIPQSIILAIIIALTVVSIGSAIERSGEKRTRKYILIVELISIAILFILLYCGNFFNGLF